MASGSNTLEHLRVVQLNADLRSAQVDLLSAQCATDRLRLRFSIEDLLRHGHRDTLRRATNSASALYEFYSNIEKALESADSSPTLNTSEEPKR
jgi:hypothetical protein